MKKLLLFTLSLFLSTTFVAQEISFNFESAKQSILKNDDYLLSFEYKLIWDFSKSEWEHNRYVIFEYNEYNNPTEKFEKWTEGSRDIYYTNLHYDNNQNLSVETKYERIDDQWIDYRNTSYNYDENNNRSQKTSQAWDGEQYVNESKSTYAYDANNKKIYQMMYYYEEGVWVESQEFDFQYDEGGNLYKIESKAWVDEEWIKWQKSIYTYDTSNLLLSIESSKWDVETSNWLHSHHKQLYDYDLNDNRIIFIIQSWNEYDFKWNNSYKSYYYYVPAASENVENISSNINKSIEDFQTTEDDIVIDPVREDKVLIGVEVLIDTVLHSSDGDLEFTISHNGISETIIYKVGGDGDNFINTKLSDFGVDTLSKGMAPFYGFYKPENPLSSFLETDPSGTWTLSIYDGVEGNTGTLQSWGLNLIFSSSSSVEDGLNDNFDLLVYPNPTTQKISLQSAAFHQQPSIVTIYDLNGKILVEKHITKGHVTAEFDVSNLINGMYFCRVTSGMSSTTKKLIIQK